MTGLYVGTAMLWPAAGMVSVRTPWLQRETSRGGRRFRWNEPWAIARTRRDCSTLRIGTLDGPTRSHLQFAGNGYDVPRQRSLRSCMRSKSSYARIVQADAILAWAETLYRSDDAAMLERARELYKAVVFLHGEDPGHQRVSAVVVVDARSRGSSGGEPQSSQPVDRARLALHQLDAGSTFTATATKPYPTLRYETWLAASRRWTTARRTAQTDYLSISVGWSSSISIMLCAKALERKARATVGIAASRSKSQRRESSAAKKLVTGVES